MKLIKNIRDQVGVNKVICALSGGVDSSVVAQLLNKAIGNQLTCMFIDQGFMRKGEPEFLMNFFDDLIKLFLSLIITRNSN